MASWKKVIVSGSNAELNQVSLGTTQLVTTSSIDTKLSGSFSGSFSGSAAGKFNGIGSGSFSGSFAGDGSGLTGVTAASGYSLTQGTGIVSFSYNGSSAVSVAVTGAADLTTNNITKWTGKAFANSSLSDNGSIILGSTSIQLSGNSSILTGSFSGSFNGTASYASAALNASTASYVLTAQTASYVLNAVSASRATSAANADTASYVLQAVSASFATNAQNATTASYVLNAVSASFATTASTALSGNGIFSGSFSGSFQGDGSGLTGVTAAAGYNLTQGKGISVFSYNGSSAQTVVVSGSTSLSSNKVTKWTGDAFADSTLTDNGTTATFSNNVVITGDLTVAGTASFTNTDNLNIKDKFILLNSGSSVLADSGWVTQYNAAGSGSAFYLDADSTGTYGRFAVQKDVIGTATSITPDEFVVTAKTAATAPSATPTWGGSSNGYGNIHVNSSTGDIYIYA